MDSLKTNSFTIVGRLANADVKLGTSSRGSDYVSVVATVTSEFGGTTHEYEVKLVSNAKKADGTENKLYSIYSNLPDMIGKKVQIDGSLEENRYWSTKTEQLSSIQGLRGRFVKGMAESVADKATYEVGGFLVSQPVERKNKAGEVYRYDVQLGQANYSGDMMSMFCFNIRPSDTHIVKGVESYNVGDTVVLNGVLDFVVKTVTQATQSAFGEGAMRTFTNRQYNFWIEGGSLPYGADDGAYTQAQERDLIAAYKAHDQELMSGASKGTSASTEPKTVTKRQTSLI